MSYTDKSKPFFSLAGVARYGYSNEEEGTATCLCGAVQLAFPPQGPGLVGVFVCNCSKCHKITASMFATNFTILDSHLKHLRGQDNLKTYSQSATIWAHTVKGGNTITNHFCGTCGMLMYRVGAAIPGMSILRVGTVDDFSLHEMKLRPQMEQFTRSRPSWLRDVQIEGIEHYDTDGLHLDAQKGKGYYGPPKE